LSLIGICHDYFLPCLTFRVAARHGRKMDT
jgi:hypothetical protein